MAGDIVEHRESSCDIRVCANNVMFLLTESIISTLIMLIKTKEDLLQDVNDKCQNVAVVIDIGSMTLICRTFV